MRRKSPRVSGRSGRNFLAACKVHAMTARYLHCVPLGVVDIEKGIAHWRLGHALVLLSGEIAAELVAHDRQAGIISCSLAHCYQNQGSPKLLRVVDCRCVCAWRRVQVRHI